MVRWVVVDVGVGVVIGPRDGERERVKGRALQAEATSAWETREGVGIVGLGAKAEKRVIKRKRTQAEKISGRVM